MLNILDKVKEEYRKETGKSPVRSLDGEDHGLSVYVEAYTDDFLIWLALRAYEQPQTKQALPDVYGSDPLLFRGDD